MNFFKKSLSTILCCALTVNTLGLSSIVLTAKASESDYKLLYTVEQDGTATITGYEGVVDTLVIPSEIDGYPVLKIDIQAFATSGEELYNDENSYCSVETLIIEDGITEIEPEAFLNCKNLKTVTLPNTLNYVWDMAFCGCDSLKEIKIPSGTGRICEKAFGYEYECNYIEGVYDYVTWTEKRDDFTVYGEVDSLAETYANKNGFTFIALDEQSTTEPITTTTTNIATTEEIETDTVPITTDTAGNITTENAGVLENAFTWSIVDDVMTLQSTDGKWTAILKNDNCIVNGVELESKEVSNEVWDTDEIKPFLEWFNEHSMNTIELHIESSYSSVGNDRYMRNISNLVIGEEVKFICDNAFTGAVQLNNVSVYSRDVDLTNSGIGYSSENEVLEDVIIYGYVDSTAETYANENGFTFIALDEQPATTTTTEPIVTTTTTDTVTTDEITTVVTTETETDTEQTTTTTTIKTETDTEPTTVPTTTDTTDNITTESSTVATVTTTGTDTTLPQTGYSKWYQVIAGLAVCMTGIGGAMVISSGKLKKKRR